MRRILLVAALCPLVAGCGAYVHSDVAIPPTTASTIPTSPTVPSFGTPTAVLAATAANAQANASGACAAFDIVYVQAAQAPVTVAVAQSHTAQALDFAGAAATGAPAQWSQLRSDLASMAQLIASPTWAAAPHQDDLAPVASVFTDCRPLQ